MSRVHIERVKRSGLGAANAATVNNIVNGQATIADGAATATVSVGTDYDGKPVVATMNRVDATSLYVKAAVVASGTLTITVNANATADTLVTYAIFGD